MPDAYVQEMFERVDRRLRAIEEAIKKYRELTGAEFAEANEIVTGL